MIRRLGRGEILTNEIIFENWRIEKPLMTIAQQYDNLSRKLIVTGELPEGYGWDMLVQCGENFDVILLQDTESGAEATLTRDQLSLAGRYKLQLRGTKGDEVRHTNCIDVYIPSSLSGDAVWPEIPSEFSEMEERLNELYAHPPIPGAEGTWLLWDTETDSYVNSDLPLPEGGYGNISSSEINTIKVLDYADWEQLSEKDSRTLYLIRG